jgi:hypothetical protein
VRDLEKLRWSLKSIDKAVDHVIGTRITRPYKSCESLGTKLSRLIGHYRTRGILKHLLEADVEAFATDLTRDALTYVTLLQASAAKMDIREWHVHGSEYYPIACALATANFDLATEIHELMPDEPGGHDQDDLFAYTSLLRHLAVADDVAVRRDAIALAETSEGEARFAAVVTMAEGLVEHSAEPFNEGLAAYLAYAENPPPEVQQELSPGEEFVSIEALAFVQLAKSRSVPVRVKHRMIPPELQNAAPVAPTDGYPAWPG